MAALAAFIYQLAAHGPALEDAYKHANLVVKTGDAAEQNRYAMRMDAGEFQFFAGAPVSTTAKLVFHKTADVRFKVKSRYPNQFCTEAGKNQATLVLHTPVEYVRKPLDKPETGFTIRLVAGDKLTVKLVNPVETQCGRATVSLNRVNNTSPPGMAAAFLLLWIVVGLLLARYSLGCLGLYGAVIHTWYMDSEALHQQAPELAMGAAGLVSMSGIGIVLLPFIARPTRFFAPPVFIIVTLILVTFPLINTGNFWLTGNAVDADVIHAIFQTHLAETLQFLYDNYPVVGLIVVSGVIALCAGLIAWKLAGTAAAPPLAGLGVVFLTLAVLSAGRISEDLRTFNTWRDASIRYYQELRAFRDLAAERQLINSSHEFNRSPGERVTVLVIGESHNKQHMSLYGYPRNTTPKLVQRKKADNLVVFENAYSNHTHTNPSLSLALTEANQYNGKNWTSVSSLITAVRRAGIRTYWISNHQMLSLCCVNSGTDLKSVPSVPVYIPSGCAVP